MERLTAQLPESIEELCFVRFGIQCRRWSAWLLMRRLLNNVDRALVEAVRVKAGLLHSERWWSGPLHSGFLQYWSSFDALESWSHQPPHADWWRDLVHRSRLRGDLGVYHEAFLVPRARMESIYLNCTNTGLANFCPTSTAERTRTTARDRLGLRTTLS